MNYKHSKPRKNNFSTYDFASLYPSAMSFSEIDENLKARIRVYERRRIIDEILQRLEENKSQEA